MSIAHRTTHCFAFCFLLAGIMSLFPDVSFASGVSEFETPFNAVMNTITGPVGKSISITLLAAAGIVYWWRRGGTWKADSRFSSSRSWPSVSSAFPPASLEACSSSPPVP